MRDTTIYQRIVKLMAIVLLIITIVGSTIVLTLPLWGQFPESPFPIQDFDPNFNTFLIFNSIILLIGLFVPKVMRTKNSTEMIEIRGPVISFIQIYCFFFVAGISTLMHLFGASWFVPSILITISIILFVKHWPSEKYWGSLVKNK